MAKNILIGALFVTVVAFGVSAPSTSALTISDIQAQIQQLLARVAELTQQINTQQNQGTSPTQSLQVSNQTQAQHRICAVLNRNLSRGVSGDDVQSLQEFLREQGYFSGNATGYFGTITASAVARWQASQGVDSVGAVGPITRERIRIWCGNGNIDTERFGANPQRGVAPLTTTFKTNVQLANSQFVADAGDYKIVFGDGSEYMLPCSGNSPWCYGPHTVTHTYTTNGTYTASLVHYGYFGIPGPSGLPEEIVASVTISVGSAPVACTKEYVPVCGSKQVQCITTPCNPVQQTYSNRCMMQADGAAFLYQGTCRDVSTDPSADARCRAWYDGCNSCSRETPTGPAMCTLRACIQQAPAYCTAYFDTTNKAPTISSFSGPTTLSVNQAGTWTISASDPENGTLSYLVDWGDVAYGTDSFLSSAFGYTAFTQNTTFTHTYSRAGTFTVSILVKDSDGQQARTSSTVRVGAELVACTADAMQCPNGQWVGRTGANCQFVCPGY